MLNFRPLHSRPDNYIIWQRFSGSSASSPRSPAVPLASPAGGIEAEANIYRDALMLRHQATLGSHFAPYQIEPKRWWRSRLDESLELEPMSDAQRAARRQWLADQRLAPEEPRYVPALYRRPFLSRLFTTPWDALLWPLRPIFGHYGTLRVRTFLPKLLAVVAVLNYVAYLSYTNQTWEKFRTVTFMPQRPTLYPGEPGYEAALRGLHQNPRAHSEQGFGERSVMRGHILTSSTTSRG